MKNDLPSIPELPYALDFRCAFISIVGRPSTGKSTLLNTMCAQKVSITSSLPQTTRNKIRGIVNRWQTDNPDTPYGQLVFLDTPGFHLSEKSFNKAMMRKVKESLEESDIILYLLDASRKPGCEEKSLATLLSLLKEKIIVPVFNKCDRSPLYLKDYQEMLQTYCLPSARSQISCVRKQGIEELIMLLLMQAERGEPYYPVDYYTDQEPTFRICEIIREKAIHMLKEEIPYCLFVEVSDLEKKEDGTLWARTFLVVDNESQKGIVIGKEGKVIRTIRNRAQKELKAIMAQPIYLDLRVKVFSKWQTKKDLINKILR